MTTPLVKVSLSAGALGVASVSGFGIYRKFFSGTSIRDTILTSSKYSNKFHKFLDSKDSNWVGIQEEYEKVDAIHKPIGKDGKEIKKEDLPSWCVTEASKDYSGKEDDNFKSILRWCYVNVNTFEEQMAGLKKELVGPKIGDSVPDGELWKNAWDVYKSKVSDEGRKITGSSNDSDLNGSTKDSGALVLKTWCSNKLSSFMYANDVQDVFRKFEEFCLKVKE